MLSYNLSRYVLGAKRRVNGAQPDSPDSRDRLITAAPLSKVVPRAATVDRGQPPKHQDGTGSCCGQGVATGVELAYLALDVKCPELSALFPYYNARRYHQRRVTDNGTGVRHAIKAAKCFGLTPEKQWPMRPAYVNRKPSWRSYQLAHDRHGVRGYYRIPRGDLESVRRAIANGWPVVAWWAIDRAFKSTRGPSVIGPCDLTQRAGNHCMLVPSYYDNGDFGLLNSWGRNWRHNGRQRVNGEFVTQGRDLWAIDVQR